MIAFFLWGPYMRVSVCEAGSGGASLGFWVATATVMVVVFIYGDF